MRSAAASRTRTCRMVQKDRARRGPEGLSFLSPLQGIVESVPFQMRLKACGGDAGISRSRPVGSSSPASAGPGDSDMFITKTSLPRRTFLRGVGATLALPLLDAMVPAATALAQTVAQRPPRFGFIYVPHGADMASWTPAAAGAELRALADAEDPRGVQRLSWWSSATCGARAGRPRCTPPRRAAG